MGDPNVTKLLESNLNEKELWAKIDFLAAERLDRLAPHFHSLGFETLLKKKPNLKILDLGTNDGTILFALKRKFPSIEVYGIEHKIQQFQKAIDFLQQHATFEIKSGTWYDEAIFPRNSFDIVTSIHAWPFPPNYDNRIDEARKIKDNETHWQTQVFEKDYSLKEIEHFLRFLKPGGFFCLRTWKTAIAPFQIGTGIREKIRNVLTKPKETFDLTTDDFGKNKIIYLKNRNLVLQKPSR